MATSEELERVLKSHIALEEERLAQIEVQQLELAKNQKELMRVLREAKIGLRILVWLGGALLAVTSFGASALYLYRSATGNGSGG